jgi:nucleotide-binding universal stress UspA family protein
VDLHVLQRDPTSAILEFAAQHGSTLIVMGTHGRSGAARWVTGSVASRVVRLAPCAVLTVRGPDRESPVSMRRFLVGVDFSECSRLALRRAAELAAAVGAELDVVHVWQVPAFLSPDAMIGQTPQQLQNLAHITEQQARKSLASLVAEARSAGSWVERARILSGEPAQGMVLEVEQGDYDLIAVGTHGRTGMRHVLLGSVAERVVRRSTRPVLTVRETGPVPA